MSKRKLHDGREDGLVPLESLNLDAVHSFADLLQAMSRTAFSGRQLGEAFEILCEMTRDDDCHIVMTLSGAMTVAKQGRIICDLIDRGVVGAVVSTGALIAHGLTESIGLTHYCYDPTHTDEELYQRGYNRIYDTLEMEANLNDVERLVTSVLNEEQPEDGQWSSARLCRALGQRLSASAEGAGILRSAYERNVPVTFPRSRTARWGSMWPRGRCQRRCSGLWQRGKPWRKGRSSGCSVHHPNSILSLTSMIMRVGDTETVVGDSHDWRWCPAQLGSTGGTIY